MERRGCGTVSDQQKGARSHHFVSIAPLSIIYHTLLRFNRTTVDHLSHSASIAPLSIIYHTLLQSHHCRSSITLCFARARAHTHTHTHNTPLPRATVIQRSASRSLWCSQGTALECATLGGQPALIGTSMCACFLFVFFVCPRKVVHACICSRHFSPSAQQAARVGGGFKGSLTDCLLSIELTIAHTIAHIITAKK
jgi:hypothetical protein